MQTRDPDVRLMLAFRDGDESALADLYRSWAGPLLRYLERMVHERPLAEEILQEAFIRVYGARERYVPEARFSTWLFRIGRNLALNELDRAHRRRPHLPASGTDVRDWDGDGSGRPTLSLVSDRPSPLSSAIARETSQRLEAALAELPERQRSALWLATVEGRSYGEIAGILDTTIPSVKSLVHRARSTLAERMDAAGAGTQEVRR